MNKLFYAPIKLEGWAVDENGRLVPPETIEQQGEFIDMKGGLKEYNAGVEKQIRTGIALRLFVGASAIVFLLTVLLNLIPL